MVEIMGFDSLEAVESINLAEFVQHKSTPQAIVQIFREHSGGTDKFYLSI